MKMTVLSTYRVELSGTWEIRTEKVKSTNMPKALGDIEEAMARDLDAQVRIFPTDVTSENWMDPRYTTITGTFRFSKMVKRHPNVNSMEEARQECMGRIINWLDDNTCEAPQVTFADDPQTYIDANTSQAALEQLARVRRRLYNTEVSA